MWVNLRTEFTFKAVYGHLDQVAAKCAKLGTVGGIADMNNTFGHIRWRKACKKAGIKPIYGVRLPVVEDLELRERRYAFNYMTLIAKNQKGLQEIYWLVDQAHLQFYYRPRISYQQINGTTDNVIILGGVAPNWDIITREVYHELSNQTPYSQRNISKTTVACIDNFYPDATDKIIYEPFADDRLRETKSYPLHILTKEEWIADFPGRQDALENLQYISDECNVELPNAPMVSYIGSEDIKNWCEKGAIERGLDITKGEYGERYKREMDLIHEKDYVDYFLVTADLIRYAKTKMAVGPSRGSSAGSLVCYLMGITEIDPLEYDLYFERFIDVNRFDLPDIDIDFQDDKRHLVIKYLEKKYGKDNVAQIGNISRMKPKSAITRFAKALNIPLDDVEELKDAIMERSGGDARANACIEDSINDTDVGRRFIEKYPNMKVLSKIEAHASHCVSGENRVTTSDGKILKVSSLYDIYHGIGKTHNSRVKRFGYNLKIRSYDFDKNELIVDDIVDVFYTGMKKTLEISFRKNKLRVTCDHLILTKGMKWVEAQNLKVGDLIATNGVFKKGCTPWNKGMKGSQVAWNKGLKNPEKSMQMLCNNPMHNPETARKVSVQNTIHGRDSKYTKQYIKNNIICEVCGAQSTLMHHIDGNPLNNPIDGSNFQALCRSCHSKAHNTGEHLKKFHPTGMTVGWASVKEITEYGVEEVYDIEMSSKNHNFVCGKVVVHNSSVHAAGILVCNDPITSYAGINSRDNKRIAMLDKKDAEAINLLKIDALGLRTLTILAAVCDQIGKPYGWLYEIPLDDKKTYDIFNNHRYNGIFQFEGHAIKSLAILMPVENMEDISALSALGRPGPLNSGGANRYVKFRSGEAEVKYVSDHPIVVKATESTFGVIVYQEQVMEIVRELGQLSWKDTSAIRKAMSKTLGVEFFDKMYANFEIGALKNGLDKEESRRIWDHINTMGSWAFNKSHSVSYGLISYLTAYMKANYPLEFLVASLNHAKNDQSAIKILRDAVENDGVEYTHIDPVLSKKNWSVQDGMLYGGLKTIHGIGPAKANKIIKSRLEGTMIPIGIQKSLTNGVSTFKYLYPARELYGDYYSDPKSHGLNGSITEIKNAHGNGMFTLIGCLIKKNLRDANEACFVSERGGSYEQGQTAWLNITLEDDTDSIMCKIQKKDYERLGRIIAETGKVDKDWYMVYGEKINNWHLVFVKNVMKITRDL